MWGGAGEGTFLENGGWGGGQREQWREHWTQGPNWPLGLREPLRALPRTSVCADKCADMHSAHVDTRTHAQTHTDSPRVHTDIHKHPTTHRHMTNTQTSPMCTHAPPFPPPQSSLVLVLDPSQVTTALTCVTYSTSFYWKQSLSQPEGGVLGCSLPGS